jgi:hypothetical protein
MEWKRLADAQERLSGGRGVRDVRGPREHDLSRSLCGFIVQWPRGCAPWVLTVQWESERLHAQCSAQSGPR